MTIRPAAAKDKTVPTLHLRLLETTDLHVHIMPYDYGADSTLPGTGLARTAQLITQARAEAANSLLFDNGDFLQGTLIADWAAEHQPDGTNPMIAAMNTLQYAGGTLGNHEFNYGLPYLQRALQDANFPFVCANVLRAKGETPADDTPLIAPWKIIPQTAVASDGSAHEINVGILGLAPPQIEMWEKFNLSAPIVTRDIVDAARYHLPRLRAAGADIIVVLCHSGLGSGAHTTDMENAARPLAALGGIDALFTGHTHRLFPDPSLPKATDTDPVAGTLHGIPTVMAGCYGKQLGIIDLTLERRNDSWKPVSHHVHLRHVDQLEDGQGDRGVVESIKPTHDAVLDHIRRPIGHTHEALHTLFAQMAPSAALALIAAAMDDAADTMLDGHDDADLPRIMAISPCKAGGRSGAHNYVSIPPGPLALRHTAELYPFPNAMCLLKLTGADVALWLETAARAFARIQIGTHDQPLLNRDIPSYNFDVLHGLTYRIDPSRPVGKRVTDICLAGGAPLTATDRILVGTNAYRASGGGGYSVARRGQLLAPPKVPLRQIIQDYVTQHSPLTPSPSVPWSFATLPDTSALFTSAPPELLPDDSQLPAGISEVGPDEAGFWRYRLAFDPPT